jgi:hypothetical protein
MLASEAEKPVRTLCSLTLRTALFRVIFDLRSKLFDMAGRRHGILEGGEILCVSGSPATDVGARNRSSAGRSYG